jgi:crotonobetainyl-CoA:carnitine CoA-transferase CaiB-like acyl-CoA transferase
MGSSGDPPLPLAGFRVLDCTKFLAGPYAAMALAYDKHPEAGQ